VRVALYGNTCNNFFAVARALRGSERIDAHLYIDDDAPPNQLPESDEPSLRAGYPSWMHRGLYRTAASRVWPRLSSLVDEFERYDLVMVSGYGVQLAPFVRRPFIFYATGWDLTVAPFPLRFLDRPQGPREHASALLNGLWQGRGISAVREIWSQPFAPFVTALHRLGVPEAKIAPRYFPIMIDTDLFQADPAARASRDPNVRRMVDGHDFVVFHPSRMMVNDGKAYLESGQWKGNDRLFEGFAKFIASVPDARPALALIDRRADRAIAQPIIDRLGLADHIVWLKPGKDQGFDRADMLPFYSVSDVVVDEFGVGWFGSIVIEGLSMGKPVLCHLDAPVMATLYPWHPILTPRTPVEIATALARLYRDPGERARLGERGRAWAIEFHSLRHSAPRYAAQVESLAGAANG
jgi:glycosyltransferase involved in cell wall biosynthesis